MNQSRIVITEMSDGIAITRHNPKISLPLVNVGSFGEEETLRLFGRVAGEKNTFKGPYLTILNDVGIEERVELCDGIVRYGDTLFLIQLKTKQPSDNVTLLQYRTWVRKRTDEASKQRKKGIKWLEAMTGKALYVEDLRGVKSSLKWERFNLVSILILAVDDADHIQKLDTSTRLRTNDKEQKETIPLIRVLLNDLLMIEEGIRDPSENFLLLEYLRAIQYQPKHILGDDWKRYPLKFPIQTELRYLPYFSKILHEQFQNGKLNKHSVKKVQGYLDFLFDEYRTEIEEKLYDPNKTEPIVSVKVEKDKPLIYFFARMTAKTYDHTFEVAKKLVIDTVQEKLLHDPKYEKLQYQQGTTSIVVFLCHINIGNRRQFYVALLDDSGYLKQEYDITEDLPSLGVIEELTKV